MRTDWPIVTEGDPGMRDMAPGKCFYCAQPIGEPHGKSCVTVVKRVAMRFAFLVDVDVPHSWSSPDIEHHYNDSSWCADNALEDIQNCTHDDGCLCSRFTAVFVEIIDDAPRNGKP